MKDIKKTNTFEKYELDKICQLLQCDISDVDKIIDNANKIYKESESVYGKKTSYSYNKSDVTVNNLTYTSQCYLSEIKTAIGIVV